MSHREQVLDSIVEFCEEGEGGDATEFLIRLKRLSVIDACYIVLKLGQSSSYNTVELLNTIEYSV